MIQNRNKSTCEKYENPIKINYEINDSIAIDGEDNCRPLNLRIQNDYKRLDSEIRSKILEIPKQIIVLKKKYRLFPGSTICFGSCSNRT